MNSYRTSHAAIGYGTEYDNLFSTGYFASLWKQVEQPLLRSTLEQLALAGATSSLDFACGTGRITEVCADVFETSHGVDVSGEMLALAREKVPKATFHRADVTRDPLTLPRFQVITAFRFFLNAEPRLRDDACIAIFNLLKPKGSLVLNVQWHASRPAGLLLRLRNRLRGHENPRTASVAEMRSLLTRHGFVVDSVSFYGLLPWLGFEIPKLTGPAMRLLERLLQRAPRLGFIAQNFMLVAHRP